MAAKAEPEVVGPTSQADKPGTKSGARPDIASILGIVLALIGIIGGLLLEGGKLKDITQYTAALIVVGGTLGAVMLTSPMSTFLAAGRRLGHVFFERDSDIEAAVDKVITFATKARKSGLVSLESDCEAIEDPYLRKALMLAVDGADLQELRKMMELEMEMEEHEAECEAKVFEQAGGYSPTVGIIGAVMGLIQVMKNLANIDEVGHGIAVSFVATVYGVGLANLFFLPVAGKIKARAAETLKRRQLMLEGVCSIVEGMNPKLIRSKLEAFIRSNGKTEKPKPAEEVANSGAKEAPGTR